MPIKLWALSELITRIDGFALVHWVACVVGDDFLGFLLHIDCIFR